MEEYGQGGAQRGEEVEMKRTLRYQLRWTDPQAGQPGARTGGTGPGTGPPDKYIGCYRTTVSSALSEEPGGKLVPAPVQTGATGL
jgi:hypothetical protein